MPLAARVSLAVRRRFPTHTARIGGGEEGGLRRNRGEVAQRGLLAEGLRVAQQRYSRTCDVSLTRVLRVRRSCRGYGVK